MKKIIVLSAILSFFSPPIVYASDVYFNDFNSSVGSGWTSSSGTLLIATSPSGEKFLGRNSSYGFSNETVSLSLSGLSAHTNVAISFDLFTINTWDGNDIANGPDIWSFKAAGQTLLNTTFTIYSFYSQAYPGTYPVDNNPARTGAYSYDTLGYWSGDTVYRLSFVLPHNADSLVLDFTGSNLQNIGDESWGLDNVRVQVNAVPIPGALFLFAPGLLGLIGLRRWNRNSQSKITGDYFPRRRAAM